MQTTDQTDQTFEQFMKGLMDHPAINARGITRAAFPDLTDSKEITKVNASIAGYIEKGKPLRPDLEAALRNAVQDLQQKLGAYPIEAAA